MSVGLLSTGGDPDWWFEPQGVDYWLGQWFNTPLEVHTFQLGLLVGVLFAVFLVRQYPRVGAVTTVVLVLFLFGVYDLPVVCSARTEACAHALLKPWYFLSGLVLSMAVVVGVVRLRSDAP